MTRRKRASSVKWVFIARMKVSPLAQRDFRIRKAEEMAKNFNLEALGYPVVNLRDDWYWLIDAQHRVEALRMIGWGDQQVECEVYEGLTEEEEAEMFLQRNDRAAVTAYDKYRIGVFAGRHPEVDIDSVVSAAQLRVSQVYDDRSIKAVAALRKVYRFGGPLVLSRTLLILRDAYPGDPAAFRSELLVGAAMVVHRYESLLDDQIAIEKLAKLAGGTTTIRHKSAGWKLKTGRSAGECTAAAIVETVKVGKGNKRLTSWWV